MGRSEALQALLGCGAGTQRGGGTVRGSGRAHLSRDHIAYAAAMHLRLVTIAVKEHDPAIGCFAGILGSELVEDRPSLTGRGRPKRWVVVRPPGAATGLLLA